MKVEIKMPPYMAGLEFETAAGEIVTVRVAGRDALFVLCPKRAGLVHYATGLRGVWGHRLDTLRAAVKADGFRGAAAKRELLDRCARDMEERIGGTGRWEEFWRACDAAPVLNEPLREAA